MFSASVTSPVIAFVDRIGALALTLSASCGLANLLALMIFAFESPGAAPDKANDRLSFPDCMFHILISPADDPARPKLPHAVTQAD